MKKIVFLILGVIVLLVTLSIVNRRSGSLAPGVTDFDTTELVEPSYTDTLIVEENDLETEDDGFYRFMEAEGHYIGCYGEPGSWDGWYFDSILVGNDIMMRIDSVGPSTVRLDLVSREITVDLKSSSAAGRMKRFLGTVGRFKRFNRAEEEIHIDSITTKEGARLNFKGSFSLVADYLNSEEEKADTINQFMCDLIFSGSSEPVNLIPLHAMYIGYSPGLHPTKKYDGNPGDIYTLYTRTLRKTLNEWKKSDNLSLMGMVLDIAVRAHVDNPRYVTFAKYTYQRAGLGHGMYTERFYTLDLSTGKRLAKADIFKPESKNQVLEKLFQVIAKDKRYSESFPSVKTSKDVRDMIKQWIAGIDEDPDDVEIPLPECALIEKGVVFSYQPYEIDSWLAGSYHFIVPYSKLRPFMTNQALRLIEN